MMKQTINGVFFDLDGTLLDTAPDMALALNIQREHHNLAPIPYHKIRPHVSHGALAMLKLGFDINLDSKNYQGMREQYLQFYADNLAVRTGLFNGLAEFLSELETNSISWGVVTNKPEFLTKPLLKALKLDHRCCSVISGDTVSPSKPHPLPLFTACRESNLLPSQCLYIGDADRDIIAGRAAGMKTVAANWGYIREEDSIDSWGADKIIKDPVELREYFWDSFSTVNSN
ncbi:HAD family hydrolase [Kangiella sediminilitoris]|uniref:Phosphoglycolate phosphatase n=1 Tax=Kangiella sediminilitoris TaxID=1144748 RepID=A0A1B3BBN4_9GAMM|nr:HAD-IA family hydrolase [Kangiella sediminilitoris]AOE50201.1 Phosphoglycolate phosphatase [Kangiella sediminilitoris]